MNCRVLTITPAIATGPMVSTPSARTVASHQPTPGRSIRVSSSDFRSDVHDSGSDAHLRARLRKPRSQRALRAAPDQEQTRRRRFLARVVSAAGNCPGFVSALFIPLNWSLSCCFRLQLPASRARGWRDGGRQEGTDVQVAGGGLLRILLVAEL